MTRWLVALAACALLLAGCSAVAAPPAGMTDAQLDDYYELQADVLWRNTLLPDDLRPPDRPAQVVTLEQRSKLIADCMNAAGFDNYTDRRGVLVVSSESKPEEDARAEKLAFYVCRSGLRVPEQEASLLNPAQSDYLYDYYEQVLVPCLAVKGITTVQSDTPTRAQYIEQDSRWNPYLSVAEDAWPRLADGAILRDCPPEPPGMPEQGITAESFMQG